MLSPFLILGIAAALPAGAQPTDGVVRGQVLMGPVCPGPRIVDRNDCAPRPAAASVNVYAAGGGAGAAPAKRVRTDAQGRFQVTLAPGQYRLVPEAVSGTATGKPREITIGPGSATDIQLLLDTGLR